MPVFIRKWFLVLFGITSLLASCKRESQSHWNTDVLVPIANTNLTIQNLVNDTNTIKTNSDNSLTLAYTSNLYNFNLADSLISIPDTAIGKQFNIDSLNLATQHFQYMISLGNLATQMIADSNPLGTFIIGENNQSIPIPAISGLFSQKLDFNVQQLFDSAILSSGTLYYKIVNDFPFPLNSMHLVIKNATDNIIIGSQTVPPIPAFDTSLVYEIPLAGKRITSQFELDVDSISTPGTNGKAVPIDTSDYLQVQTGINGLYASEAWAKFPTQNVVNQTAEVTQVIRDRKLTFVNVRQGTLHVFITSSVPQKMQLTYSLLGAYDNRGRPLVESTPVPAAPLNSTVTIDSILNIAGFSINLTGVSGTQFNTYSQQIIAQLDSSGITEHITNQMGINVRYEITQVAPNYIKGYLGRDTINAIDTAAFSFLNVFQSGKLDLSQVTMNFDVQNGLGVPGQVKINSLSANSPVNGTVALQGSILNTPLSISSASDFPLRPGYNTYALNSTGNAPNLPQLLDILPNEVQYNVQVQTNVKGNNQQYQEFVYLESGLNINLDAQIPLSLIASNLVLLDTLPFNLSNANLNVNGITDGIINLVAENKFPIVPVLTMIVYDSTWAPVDTLLLKTTVAAGLLDANCMVDAPKQTVIQLPVSQARLNNIKRGRNAIITANFSTSSSSATCNGQHLKIYSNYNLGITFTAKFNYEANAKF